MNRVTLVIVLGLMTLCCFSQDGNNKFLIGASIGFSHDDLSNNRLLSNYFPYDKNISNTFDASGEFGFFLTQNTLLGFEIGYLSNSSKQERKIEGTQITDIMNVNSYGVSINLKYKVIKRFSEKIWFYIDSKFLFQYLSHKNMITQVDVITYEYENLNMNGMELKYGFSIDPGLILKINKSFGVKVDYSLINVIHSTIKKTDDSDIDFENIKAWDYNLNMKPSGINLGIIFNL